MGKLSGLIVFLLVIFAVTSCVPPIGNIGGTIPHDAIWAVPYRIVYDINDLLLKQSDFLVFASFRGSALPIPNNDIEIGIVEDPDFAPNNITPVPPDESYLFRNAGRKVVVITYNKLSTRYSIDVRDPFGLEEPGNGNGNGGSGVGIIWWRPRS
jgi:hypothetical protein